ncbi:hypothetical protein IAU60_000226 [Kwoniella sp. DSM 27419]
MFQVPQHLPRMGEVAGGTSSDPVMDFIQPLIPPNGESSTFTTQQVKSVREQLERAVKENKSKTHDIVLSSFPTISSHIQLSDQIRSDTVEVEARLSRLSKEVDPSDAQTSFLPPLLTTLNKHYAASTSRTAAQTHIRALSTLSKHTERLHRLEEAVWAGKGADESVVDSLNHGSGFELDEDARVGEDVLRGTQIRVAIEAKQELLKALVIGQLTDGFGKAISISSSATTITVSVNSAINLPQPKSSPPAYLSPSGAPSYTLAQLLASLSHLALLRPLLAQLSNKLSKEVIQPVISGSWRPSRSETDGSVILSLDHASQQPPSEILDNVKTVLNFIGSAVIPSASCDERETFLEELNTSTFRHVLHDLILPAMPANLARVEQWSKVLAKAIEVETAFAPSTAIIKPFFEQEAGKQWAQKRRYAVADQVRSLILSGWGGWENALKERQKDTFVYVEVEVDEAAENHLSSGNIDHSAISSQFSSHEDSHAGAGLSQNQKETQFTTQDVTMEDDGWGFDESATPAAGPSTSPTRHKVDAPVHEDQEMDGWDLDPAPASAPIKPASPPKAAQPVAAKTAKPAREAKRLGKKLAKVRAEEDDDPWGSGTDSAVESNMSASVQLSSSGDRASPRPQSPLGTAHPPEEEEDKKEEEEDGWGWDDDSLPTKAVSSKGVPDVVGTAPTPSKRPTRKEIREEKRTLTEEYRISVACEDLLAAARSVLDDLDELHQSSPDSPSFARNALEPILSDAVREIFTLYRALLPTYYAKQLIDVPSLAMQAYNDSLYLATSLSSLISNAASDSTLSLQEESERLLALSDHLFEEQLESQRAALFEELSDLVNLEGTTEEKVFHRDERVLKGIVHNLESLSRAIQPILPRTKVLEITSYLVTALVSQLTHAVLELGDITEIESNRLTELFKLVYPLEHLFDGGDGATTGGVVLHVGGWLKFCYISEILQASLVDITYLLDSGSLVDFTPDELVGLVRALFATSEKRDGVVDRIERDGTAGTRIAPPNQEDFGALGF